MTFLFTFLASLFNASNDFVYKFSSQSDRNKVLSFYLISAISAASISLLLSFPMSAAANTLEAANIKYGVLIGCISFFTYLFYIFSFTGSNTPAYVTIYRLNLIPGVLFATIFLKEALSPFLSLALAAAVIGIILLLGGKPTAKKKQTELKPLVFCLTASLLGGVMNVLNKVIATESTEPLAIGFWRFLTVTVLTLLFVSVRKIKLATKGVLWSGIASGALLLGAIITTLLALETGDVSYVIPLLQILAIVIVSFASWTILKEKATCWKVIGLFFSITAVILINL